MHTVGRLARRFGLSRTTLLYYDSIGLLAPASRSHARYRLYGDDAVVRLGAICRYREAGVPLAEIRTILASGATRTVAILERRLASLGHEIARLREQERVVVRLLARRSRQRLCRAMDKRAWVALLRASGLSDADMHLWHVEFERMAPEAHGDFLESLGIAPREVARIRSWARREVEGKGRR
jgi:DNA-binding transcriptional MerR regulator